MRDAGLAPRFDPVGSLFGLAEGRSLDEAAREAGAHIEGVKLASRLAAHAERLGLEAPICRTIVDVLEGTPAQDAIRALMARDAGTE